MVCQKTNKVFGQQGRAALDGEAPEKEKKK